MEVHSIKTWLIAISVFLLTRHYLEGSTWATFVGTLLTLREGSEVRQNYHERAINGQSNGGPKPDSPAISEQPHD